MNTTTPYTTKTGDIFLMSWGYDQTNVNFFQVTKTTPKGVYVREIASKGAGGEGFMCQNVVANPGAFLGRSQWCGNGFNGNNEETFKKIKLMDGKPYFSVRGRYFAFLWDGKETYNSWYA